MKNKIDIGCGCYVSCMSKAELVRPDTGTRIALTPTEYKIICYLVDNAGLSVQLESIAVHLWGSNYSADRKDPESIKSHIARIRSKLSRLHPVLKDSLATNFGYGSYVYVLRQAALEDGAENSFLVKVTAYSQSVADPYKEVTDLSEQLDKLVMDLEVIQGKLDIARNSQNHIWEKIYGTQFEALYFNFCHIKDQLEEKQVKVRCVKESLQGASSGAVEPGSAASASEYDFVSYDTIWEQANEVSDPQRKISYGACESDDLHTFSETWAVLADDDATEYGSVGPVPDVYLFDETLEMLADDDATEYGSAGSEPDVCLYDAVWELTNDISELQKEIQSIACELEDLCYQFLNGELTPDDLGEWLNCLPSDRKTALALASLTDSLDTFDVYYVIFSRYKAYLSEYEKQCLMEKARALFEPEILKFLDL